MPELNYTIRKNDTNLKAYYRFESGAETTDSSGNANTLTAISDPAGVAGVFGQGIDLDGGDGYSITDGATVKPTGSFSIGSWIKTSTTGAVQQIFASFSANTNYAGVTLTISSTNKAQIFSAKNTGIVDGTDHKNITGNTTITDGIWHFIVGTWDGATLRIYVDGKHDGSVAWANAPAYAATNYVRIGCQSNSGTNINFMTGSLDDLFLLNGTALSADQIKELYEGRYIGEGWPQAGLVAGYHLNGHSTDFSGNNNHGTDTAITYSLANGKFNQGGSFNGTTSRIQCADSATLTLGGPYTINLWINPTALPSSGAIASLICKYDSGANEGGYDLRLYNDGGTQKIGLLNTNAGIGGGDMVATLSTSVWSMLTAIYDGSYSNIYINGAFVVRTANTVNPKDNTKLLNIGNFGILTGSGDIGRWFNGKMDEIHLYNVAKDANWVRKQYAWGLGKFL